MAFAPIAFVIPEYDRNLYKNWWLKAYEPGTTTPKAMATDQTGSSTASRYELNTQGFPITAGNALVVPHIDGDYDLWLFPTAAEADTNDTTNALQFADNLGIVSLIESVSNTSSDVVLSADTVADLKTKDLQSGQFIRTKVNNTISNAGGAPYRIVTLAEFGGTPDGYKDIPLDNGNVAVFNEEAPFNLLQFGLIDDWDFEAQTGTDNSALYQTICRDMQDGKFNHVYFPKREGKAYYFAPQPTKSTCVFLKKDPTNFTANPNPCIVSGDGVIAVDNNGQNNVWMSSPDDVDGTSSSDVVTDFHIEGNLTITSAYLTAADRVTYDSPQTTLPNFGIGFNIGRWWRSSWKANFEFVKGIVQAPPADGLYDSTNGFIQQAKIYDCRSTHAQENFIEVTQGWSTDIIFNTVERGNGGIDMQRSSGQSFYRTNVNGNTFQGNGGGSAGALYTFRCNFGVSFTFTSNYFESNRSASGVAAVHVRMSPNNIQNLNSFTFEGNFFAHSDANLDGFGAEYAHVELDAFKNFFPKGNNFTGGNGYKMSNSTGRIYSQNETYTVAGSIYPEGQVATTNSDIPGAIQLGSVYQDTDNESVVSCTKYRSSMADLTIQQATIAASGSFDFRKPSRGVCIISSDPANDTTALGTQAMFAVSGNTVAPEGLALSASNVYVFSLSPTAPAASTFDVAVNASNDRITVQNGFGSSREVTLITIGNGDWV